MKLNPKLLEWVHAMQNKPTQTDPAPIAVDPDGAYTGRPLDPAEKPVQDADDL